MMNLIRIKIKIRMWATAVPLHFAIRVSMNIHLTSAGKSEK